MYAAPGSQLTAFRRDGQTEPVTAERELGRPVYSATVTLASGATQTLEYDWVVADAWQPGHDAGGYRLNVDGQPALLDGATSVRVHPPDDGSGLQPDPPLTRRDGAAVWTGAPSEGVVLQAEVVAAPSARLARLVDALNRPLLEVLAGRPAPTTAASTCSRHRRQRPDPRRLGDDIVNGDSGGDADTGVEGAAVLDWTPRLEKPCAPDVRWPVTRADSTVSDPCVCWR